MPALHPALRRVAYQLAALLIVSLPAAYAATAPFRVVIDPGHGGTDLGTVYYQGKLKIAEKQVTLLIAQETARQLKKQGIEAVLTRNADKEVALPDRTALANRMNADIFVSIHMNSTPTPWASDAQGVETYILNNTSDASSRRLASLENTVVHATASDSPEQVDVAMILKDLTLDGNLTESKRLACAIQENLVSPSHTPLKRRNRGVKQALFHVLLGADMPSVLVEAGFLSSAKDRKLVLSAAGRQQIATSLSHALERYRKEKGNSSALAALGKCKVH